jgi:chemotaxis protein MotB
VGKKLEKKGVPAYMVTLGDMWSLMLTFFIMLFAMSEIDATKFRKIQGTLKDTFGYNQPEPEQGPPPGVSMINSTTAASGGDGSESVLDESAKTSIVDPQLASIKIEACERQLSKDSSDQTVGKRNGVIIKKIIKDELSAGTFVMIESGKSVRLTFKQEDAFGNGTQLRGEMKKALMKLGIALNATQGDVLIRSYLPPSFFDKVKSAYEKAAISGSAISAALLENTKLSLDRVAIESMSTVRAPSSVKSIPGSSVVPIYEITVEKN